MFDVAHMKLLVWQHFFQRSKSILQTQLNSGNNMNAINMFAIPVVRYSAALLEWSSTELNQLDVKF